MHAEKFLNFAIPVIFPSTVGSEYDSANDWLDSSSFKDYGDNVNLLCALVALG